jgi:hypothetical protein
MKPSAAIVRRVAALGLSDAVIRRYLAAMERTPTGRSAGPARAADVRGRYAGISFAPPSDVRERAVEALEWRFRDGHKGGTGIGVGRALQLALEPTIPPRDIDRIVAYGTRHRIDLDSDAARAGEITPGVVAYGLWGGHAGIAWARRVQTAMRAHDARRPRPNRGAIDPGLAAGMPVGWSEDYAQTLRRIVQGKQITVPAALADTGDYAALLRLRLIRVARQWTAAQMLYETDVYDLAPTPKGTAALAWRDAWYDAQARSAQVGLFGARTNPAPGYRSWAWASQEWRVVRPRADGTVDYAEVCGAPANRTATGHVRLCLPVAVIRALAADIEGRRILHAQAVRKARAKPGARVPWHPVIRELWRAVEARTEADDPRLRSKLK